MTIFRRISRAIARVNRSLGADEGTSGGTAGVNPALRHVQAAEREEFPAEELPADEQEENE